MPQGRQYFIYQLTARGYGSASTDIKATDTKTNHHEFPTFVLKRADRKLAGQILDLGGKPVSGATVRFNGQGQPQFGWQQLETKTDSQGHFAFDKVCEGVVNIYANWNNVRTNILAYGGDTNILIKLGVTNAFPAAPPLRGSPIH